MALYLVNPAVEMTLELYVSQSLEESLTIQYERIRDQRVRATFVKRLEKQVETLLRDSLDWDLKEPTQAQLSYAILVAKRLGISLPSEARKFRFHAAMFLETYAPELRTKLEDSDQSPDLSAAQTAELLVESKLRRDASGQDS